MTRRERYRKVRSLVKAQCAAWGGMLVVVQDKHSIAKVRQESFGLPRIDSDISVSAHRRNRDGYSTSPSMPRALGLDWEKKTIYITRTLNPACAIHEMGHVFLARNMAHPRDSIGSVEFEDEWLGWEICLAKQLGCYDLWDEQNVDYSVNERGDLWGNLSSRKKAEVVRERIAHAKRIGLCTEDGTARAFR